MVPLLLSTHFCAAIHLLHVALLLLLLMITEIVLLLLLQGKRAALRSSTIMIRQPLQRLVGMQASDIDIYRRVTREKTGVMVRAMGAACD